jgi:hypothetical protein
MKCHICKDTGYYRFGRSYKRCACGAEPQKVPEGADVSWVQAGSKAAEELQARKKAPPACTCGHHHGAEVPADAALPPHVIDQIARLLGPYKVPFVLTWLDRGELQTLHGLGPHVVAGPRSQAGKEST